MSSKKATTLVEIMAAIAILSAVVLSGLGLISYLNRGTREQDVEGIAANFAKEKMNQLLYVISRDNLISGAHEDTTETIKGYYIKWSYEVYPFENNEVNFKIPKFIFHDPIDCSDGKESHDPSQVIDSTPDEKNLAEIFPDVTDPLIVDICMTVSWKLPNEANYDPKNTFKLIARRTFPVTQ